MQAIKNWTWGRPGNEAIPNHKRERERQLKYRLRPLAFMDVNNRLSPTCCHGHSGSVPGGGVSPVLGWSRNKPSARIGDGLGVSPVPGHEMVWE